MKKALFIDALGGFYDLIIAGVLWLICSLPIITVGPATAALYYTVVKCIRRDRGRVIQTFFNAFKTGFKDSFVIWLIYLAYLAVITADRFVYGKLDAGEGGIFSSIATVLFVPPVLSFPWMFAYISRFSNTRRNCFLCTVSLTVRHFGKTVLLALILGGTLLLAYLAPITIPFIIGPCALLSSLVIEPVFRELTKEMNTDGMDPWFNE